MGFLQDFLVFLVTTLPNEALANVVYKISMIFWSLFCSIMSCLSALKKTNNILVTDLLNYELDERPGRFL